MKRLIQFAVSAAVAVALNGALLPSAMQAQTKVPASAPVTVQSPSELGVTQAQLMQLLRVSPQLANVVSSDPSLLSNLDYVSHSNPELAQFLSQHPEITRNPSFYLFQDLKQPGQRPYDILEPKEGFERHYVDQRPVSERVMNDVAPLIALAICAIVAMWLIKLLVESRRWKRVFTEQSAIHSKLIDKMASSQELMGYMETEAGRRFLEATPIATESGSQRMPNVVSRILSTTQVGVVLTMLGAGLLGMRNSVGDGATTMLVLGIMTLMPGLGLMLSAGLTWALARKLSLISDVLVPNTTAALDLRERQ
jgi:ABC-type multidrug transport system fused ATPase/permease subunit